MRANYRMQRLFIDHPLAAGAAVPVGKDQFHYLANVLRIEDGTSVLVFNGRDGEWRATVGFETRKRIVLTMAELARRARRVVAFLGHARGLVLADKGIDLLPPGGVRGPVRCQRAAYTDHFRGGVIRPLCGWWR